MTRRAPFAVRMLVRFIASVGALVVFGLALGYFFAELAVGLVLTLIVVTVVDLVRRRRAASVSA